jgi:hypothetical protein
MSTKKPSAADSGKNSGYSEASIKVLKGLEPVKQRPGMYTRTENPLHIIQEVIDNASDEALGGYGKQITVTLRKKACRSSRSCSRACTRAASSIKPLAARTRFRAACTAWVCP